MKRRTTILIAVVLLIAAAAIYAYREFTRKPVDMAAASPDFRSKADDIIRQLRSNDSAAFKKMEGKIIEITGIIKDLSGSDQNVLILLGDQGSMESVRCSMDSSTAIVPGTLRIGESVTIRGTCSGVDADELLGTDLLMNRCVIVKTKR